MQRLRSGPDLLSLLPVVVLLFGAVPLATSSRWLVWLLLLPLAAAVWVVRARVVADDTGLEVCNGLRRRTHPWSRVAGFEVPRRGPVRLLLEGGGRVLLTALPRRDLRRLVAAAPVVPSDEPAGGRPAQPRDADRR